MEKSKKKNQKEKIYSNAGITLIALVVTIIVLLILAAVSIQMLTGDNGIITNASKVSTSNAYYSAEEQVKLAYMAVKAEISSKTVALSTYNPEGETETAALAAIVAKDLGANQTGSKWAVDGSTAGSIKIVYTDPKIDKGTAGVVDGTLVPKEEGKVQYKIVLQKSQDATLYTDTAGSKLASEIISEAESQTTDNKKIETYQKFYGKVVDYPVQITTSLTNSSGANKGKWKVFYADESHIYLISDSRIEVPNSPDTSKFPNNGILKSNASNAWNARFGTSASNGIFTNYSTGILDDSTNNTSNGINILKHVNNNVTTLKNLNKDYYYNADGTAKYGTSTTGGGAVHVRAVASMLDTSSWEMFRNSNYAEYAIGGPSVEMFCESYSQTHTQGLQAQAVNNNGTYGYKVWNATLETPAWDWISGSGSIAAYNSSSAATAINQLYRPDSTSSSTEHFWLASPSAFDDNSVMAVGCSNGNVSYDYYNATNRGFRPLVCLKSNVQLVEASQAKKDQGIDFELR